jgi:threonylcarbamoyladenosine tRNA methylthiotransferase MtaB
MSSVLINTLGCKLNQLESEAFADTFIKAGFTLHDSSVSASPSIIIINTCTVTSKADQKARRIIRKALRDYIDSLVIVTGCYAQLDKSDIEKLDNEKRLFVAGKDKILDFLALLREQRAESREQLAKNREQREEYSELLKRFADKQQALLSINSSLLTANYSPFQFSPERFSSHTKSFLKIQDGCDNKCSYCRIRLARGNSISLPAEVALERLKILEKNHADAVLTGVNICQYRDPSDKLSTNNLTGLLEYLLAGTEKISLHLSSLEPEFVDENFAKILSHKRIRPHFHLSIQSCSKKILQKMGRSYDSQIIKKVISLLRCAKDDPFLACDIITGFPGETDTDFNETYELCKETGFAWIHVFPYSKRPGTPAWSFTDTVQEREVTRRVQLLTDLAWQGRQEYIQRWLGKEVEVLIEKSSGKHCRGITENYLKVLVQHAGEQPQPGAVLRCKLAEIGENQGDFDAITCLNSV